MINFELKHILQEQALSQYKLSKLTGIRPNTINNIVNNRTQRIEIATLNNLMIFLSTKGYDMSDLIQYTKDEHNQYE